MCFCCKTVSVRGPVMTLATALDPNLDDDYEVKRKSYNDKLTNIACEINLFNDKQRSYKHNIHNFLNDVQNDDNVRNISLNVPRIVVVGTQTSGKSSLVNRMIGMELLPTGNNMVTRSPIYIEIKKCERDVIPFISLSCIDEGREINFFSEKLAILSKEQFREKIKEISLKLTGNDYSITKSPIVIKIHLYDVSPLFLVDLPGLVLIARTEKGQRDSIITDIKNLVREQLLIPNTYAIVAIQSKIDMETDMGLSIVKEIQKEKPDLRAFGILTKPDLLDKRVIAEFDTLIGDNLIDKSLSTDMGFFVINNMRDEYGWYENQFGRNSKIIKSGKYGIKNFMTTYRKKLTAGILAEIPTVRDSLILLKDRLIAHCPQLGNEIKESHEKQLFIDSNLHILSKLISNSIESLGNKFNIGPEIKKIIETMMSEIDLLRPFAEYNMSNDELNRIINSFDGFSQTSQSKKALIISRCLENKEKMPVGNIINKIKNSTSAIKIAILELVKTLLEERKLDIQNLNSYSFQIREFPKLKEFVIKSVSRILDRYEKDVIDSVEKSLVIQEPTRRAIDDKESYNNIILGDKKSPSSTSTKRELKLDTLEYEGSLNSPASKGSYESQSSQKPLLGVSGTNGISIFDIQEKEQDLTVKDMRNFLILSFEQISKIAKENAIKAIESLQLRKFQERFMNEMLRELKEHYKKYTIENLFFESDEIAERNKIFIEFIADIDRVLGLIRELNK